MSIDVCVRLYFPTIAAPAALRALAELMHGEGGRAVVIALPDGDSFAIPAFSSKEGQVSGPYILAPGASIDSFDTSMTVVIRRKKKLPRGAKPHVNRWGDEEYFKVVKVREYYQVCVSLCRGRDYFEIDFSNITSADVMTFYSKPFRSRLSHLYAEGNGVAGVYIGQGEWGSFAEPNLAVHLPDDPDEEDDEGNTDDGSRFDKFVDLLREAL